VGPADGDLANDIVNLPDFGTTIYIQSDANSGLVFYGANFAALKAAANTRRLPVTLADADIFQYQAHVYYLRPCSRPTGGGGACLGSDDGGRPIPTLVRQELNGSAMIEVPLVEGIERIDFRYGIDNEPAGSPDGVPERFSAAPAAGDWANVTTVRVTILVRSPNASAGYDDNGKTYDLDGDGVADFTCAVGVNCNFKRKVFSQTFQLRNIAQRRGA
jgi:type IV pilus assembly protein PilW